MENPVIQAGKEMNNLSEKQTEKLKHELANWKKQKKIAFIGKWESGFLRIYENETKENEGLTYEIQYFLPYNTIKEAGKEVKVAVSIDSKEADIGQLIKYLIKGRSYAKKID